jgi:hypothetical protein
MAADPELLVASTAPEMDISLLDVIDHVLNSGVVIQGSIVISIAGVDLVYLGLNVVLTSVETALRSVEEADRRAFNTRPLGSSPRH